jgi:predicted transcriptional regulator
VSTKSIGDQEMALLQFIAAQGGATVGEVAADFGKARGLARSTVLTMMERLRDKSYLRRKKEEGGVFRYRATANQDKVVQRAISTFVEKTLQGSPSPFVAWLSQRTDASPEDLEELKALVASLESKRGRD